MVKCNVCGEKATQIADVEYDGAIPDYAKNGIIAACDACKNGSTFLQKQNWRRLEYVGGH